MSSRIERKLAQSLAREKAVNRAKDEFLAALSHELRTPLNPVLLLASEGASNQNLPPQVRTDFDSICKNIEIEARLIDDLLDMARIKRGKFALSRSVVDVHAALQSAVSIVEGEIAQKHIFLKVHFRATLHQIHGDYIRLQQIFWNVLRNAVKFSSNGGQITLDTDTFADKLIVKVTDTGIGMTREEIKNIFDEFSQGAHGKVGLGLGLAISRKLVELQGGSIQATSLGKNKGATFSIEFPVTKVSEKGA